MIDDLNLNCAEPLPIEAQQAITLFNAGEYYQQHDALEALWRAEPRRVRDLYQGVLQVGVGYYQVTLGNWRGAIKMLSRAERWLSGLPDRCRGVNVARLRADAAAVRVELVRVGEGGIADFDRAHFQPVRYTEDTTP